MGLDNNCQVCICQADFENDSIKFTHVKITRLKLPYMDHSLRKRLLPIIDVQFFGDDRKILPLLDSFNI